MTNDELRDHVQQKIEDLRTEIILLLSENIPSSFNPNQYSGDYPEHPAVLVNRQINFLIQETRQILDKENEATQSEDEMTEKFMVKVMQADMHVDNLYGDEYEAAFYPAVYDWDEVTEEELREIQQAVNFANAQKTGGYFFIVKYNENTLSEMFKTATAFKEKMKREEEKREKAKAEAKRQRHEKAQERKRKQLEKLKKELGEE